MATRVARSSVGLVTQGHFSGCRALAWHGRSLYVGQRYTLWRWEPECVESRWTYVARFQPRWDRRVSSVTRLGSRLRRDGFHALEVLSDGSMVAVLPGAIAVLPPGETTFRVTWRIQRGTRPLGLAQTASGAVFWGEYYANKSRDSVHVYGSLDGGRRWEIAHTFEAGCIRHVHNIVYDRFEDCLWMVTGDADAESRVIRVSSDWREMRTVLSGSQQTRVLALVPTEQALYFATDTPSETNHIYRLRRGGTPEPLAVIAGSGMRGCRVGRALFFSSGVEPSAVNQHPFTCLYGSSDGRYWTKLRQWRADFWAGRLFQYSRFLLPRGENATDILAGTSVAVKPHDGTMVAWRVSQEGDGEPTVCD